jgi:hypothetical protein
VDGLTYIGALCDAYRTARQGQAGVARRQQQRLQDLVAYARAHSPYYTQLYRDAPQPVSEIRQLPVVTKAELMSHFDDWVTDPAVTRAQIEAFLADPGNVGRDFLGRYVVCTTSGATGIPAILLHDHAALVVYNVLGYARSLPALLLSPGPVWALLRGRGRLAAVFVTGGHFLGNTMMARRIRKMPWRARMQRIFSALTPVAELVSDLNTFQPVVLGGYPSGADPCPCRSPFPSIHVVGRTDDILSHTGRRTGSDPAAGHRHSGRRNPGSGRLPAHSAHTIESDRPPGRGKPPRRRSGMGCTTKPVSGILVCPRGNHGHDREGRRSARATSTQRKISGGLLRAHI